MDVKMVVDGFGGQTALAALLSIRQSAIAYWVKRGAIPQKWHDQLRMLATEKGVTFSAEMRAAEQVQDGGKTALAVQSDSLRENTPFLFYAAGDGSVKVQVLVLDESVWASQKGMSEIFDVDVRTVNEHLQNIFKTKELDEELSTVIRNFRITADDGKEYNTSFYNLDAIISVGYRVNSFQATQFRKWATTVLKSYLIRGYALDDDRLKQGKGLFGKDYFDDLLDKIREIRASERRFYQKITDLFAQCSIDYDKSSPLCLHFYAHVQDKMHFAVHHHTSAELIAARADANKPHMGLQTWKNEGKGGKVTKSDVTVGKNYLTHEEITELDRLVSMYLDWAENFARRHKALTMKDWTEKLDGFLEFNAYDVLENFGRARRATAERHALIEYDKFRVVQDAEYRSDFDKVVDEIKVKKRLPRVMLSSAP